MEHNRQAQDFTEQNIISRNERVMAYLHLVPVTIRRSVPTLPPNVEWGDLESAGMIGLIKAAEQFDPNRGTKFPTYAIALIRGAILEYLRDEDWTPRSVRDFRKDLERTERTLSARYRRAAKDAEVARAMGIRVSELDRRKSGAALRVVCSKDDPVGIISRGGFSELTTRREDIIIDPDSDPYPEAEASERAERLAAALDRLPDRERYVIVRNVQDGISYRAIAVELGISESRTHQLFRQGVERLRNKLRWWDGFADEAAALDRAA